MSDIESMSVRELKEYITRRGMTYEDCVEKADLQGRAREASTVTTFTCAICLEEETAEARMPCCHTEGSSVSFCQRCISVIVSRGGGIGKCPR